MKYIKPLILLILIIIFPNISDASENVINQLKEGGKVIFIRHGFAPGNGDPDNFLVNDCSTQRNLDKNGINQSRKIGKLFKKNKIPVDTVLSSEWCRCKDTAFYAFKDFETKSFLNSFYDIKFQKNKNRQIKQLKDYIKTGTIPKTYQKNPWGTRESQIAPIDMPNEGHYPGVK